MPVDLSKFIVVAISSRALFDLEEENDIFEAQGKDDYCRYQVEHENEILAPGTGFPLVKSLLGLNSVVEQERKVEVVVVSRNNADTGIRISNSINAHELDITRMGFTSGQSVAKYLKAFDVDLFLSASEEDVQHAANAGYAAGLIYAAPADQHTPLDEIRIAFDGDAVLFSDESEMIYQTQGIDAFMEHERANAKNPLPEGPFAKLLKMLSYLQNERPTGDNPIRTALVTARNSPAHERVLRTLRVWNVRVDEAFFLGGVSKDQVLKAFQPHIFFDDQDKHCAPASKQVPTARVLGRNSEQH